MDLQKLINSLQKADEETRRDYHATLGDLIDALKQAKESCKITPKIAGIGAYRGYYSDIALCTEGGNNAYKTEFDYNSNIADYSKWNEENEVSITFSENPHELAIELESLIGMYFNGYKGGYNKITRDKVLWLATDYGNNSDTAIVEITPDLKLITKQID